MLKLLIKAGNFVNMLQALGIFAEGLNMPDGHKRWTFLIFGPMVFGGCLYNLFRKVPESSYPEIRKQWAMARAILLAMAIAWIPPIVLGSLVAFFMAKH